MRRGPLVLVLVAAAACGNLVGGGSDDTPSPTTGSEAGADATIADGATTPDGEAIADASDAGSDADADAGPKDSGLDAGCLRAVTCERAVFVTSTSVPGDFASMVTDPVKEASRICQTLANASTHPRIRGRTFLAWLAAGNTSPAGSFVQGNAPYVLANGTVVANNWTDLVDGTIDNAIDHDQNGTALISSAYVWTGTGQNGAGVGTDCTAWTTQNGNGKAGSTAFKTASWASATDQSCQFQGRFYCIEE